MHLLVVEDDARLRHLLGRLLDEERHVVELAADGEEGLEIAADGRGIDAIILDGCARRARACPSSCSRRGTPSRIASPAWTRAPTTTS
jgi:DNA-binding NtrC family response regulator